MNKRLRILLVILALFCFQETGEAKEYELSGICVYVTDGDTFRVKTDKYGELVVRFYGIDAPEKKQVFYQQSKEFLASLILEKPVILLVQGRDLYGRYIAKVFHEQADVGLVMVRLGFAFWYKSYAKKDKLLINAEKEAKKQHLGIWGLAKPPVEPWVFRKMKVN